MENNKIESYQGQNHQKEQAYARAKKRVKELKGFYWHAFWYLVINIFIISINVSNTNDFWHFGTYSTALFWGVGLAFHALGVFGKNLLFSKSWGERKVKEYLDKDKTQWK